MLKKLPLAVAAAPVQPVSTGSPPLPPPPPPLDVAIVKETDFAAEVLFLSVVIVTPHVYSPSARFSMEKVAVAPVWFESAATGVPPFSA